MSIANQYPPKLQFAGHETFPLRQLWLRKAFVAVAESSAEPDKRVFADEAAIRRFGVGKNMVASIRHWALACDVLRDAPGSSLEIGEIGHLLFGDRSVDPFLERPATAWLVHWLLAGRAERSATWFYIFNRVTQQMFTRASLLSGLQAYVEQRGSRVAAITLKRDVEVCLRCYVSRRDGRSVDDAAEPLLVDLGLLAEGPGEVLQFRRGNQATLPDGIFGFALLEFWKRREEGAGSGPSTLSFEAIAHEHGSPGRVFKLDEDSVADRLISLETVSGGSLQWSDSAGIRQISCGPEVNREKLMRRLLRGAYAK